MKFLVNTFKDDPEVRLLRVKNRLTLDYDESITAGYRDVAFNMALNTMFGFVFEVQLILKSFYKLKSDEGHAGYRKYRDLRIL